MPKHETSSDEARRFGSEMMRIIFDSRNVQTFEQRVKLREDINGYLDNERIEDHKKEQLLSRVAQYAKDPADRQWADVRLAERRETKMKQDTKDEIQRIEDYANEGFIDEMVRDAQLASDKDIKEKADGERGRRAKIIDIKAELEGWKVAREAERIVREAERIPGDAEVLIRELEDFMNPGDTVEEVQEHLRDNDAIKKELNRPETRVALEKSRIKNALATLSEESRLVMEAVYFTHKHREKDVEKDVEEVAQELGLSVERVKKIRDEAFEQLKKVLS